ncbi:hypothetical protein ABZS66_13435 [Dactylosporangium sp. NPDC005572]|uniref:hypothetical protein n=1 Tax=Dactylosporangium sp. NPDC005572 TaxID=3156889 RepID=UPI0033A27DE5
MLVRCVRIISPFGEPVETYPGVTVGAVYPVLEIAYLTDVYYVRIVDDESDGPGSLWSPEMFETVDGHLPTCWSSAMAADGSLRLAPSKWLRPGFWTDCLDRDPVALADYAEGKAAVLADAATP